MREDPLTPAQRAILEKLRDREIAGAFYLGGGSALALRLRHRRSLDHDFFSQEPFQPSRLASSLAGTFPSSRVLQIAPGTLSLEIEATKAGFYHYPYPLLEKPERVDDLFPVASLLDLALMKLTAIGDRGARKDFIDLFAILRAGVPLERVFESLPRKFPGVKYQAYHFLKALSYFEDAREEPLEIIGSLPSWEEIQEFFRAEVRRLSPRTQGRWM